MDTVTLVILIAAAVIVALAVTWIVTAGNARNRYLRDLSLKDAAVRTAETLRDNERERHEKAIAELKEGQERALTALRAGQEKAIEAARTALALENEKTLKAREDALKKEAAETMKVITGGLNKDIRDMKEAFDAQKKTQAEESSAIKTQFEETVKHLRQQTESIGTKAESLANALRGKNKMQGIFGETILENILKAEGLRPGHDYETEFWLRDKQGNIVANEETGRRMRPDCALHFPDETEILIDAKVSLTALADYFAAETEAERADASRRNLESVKSHIDELTGKDYQRYVSSRKTLDYVIMFIPNYGAYQLAKQEDPEIFAEAFAKNVLITTEETLIPFLRIIRTAWIQRERMENIAEIVESAQKMVDRVALFCAENARVQQSLETVLDDFKRNSARLVDGRQSIVKAAQEVAELGIKPTKRELPPLGPALLEENPQENEAR